MKKLLVVLFVLWAASAFGATYYVDGSAADDTGDGSVGSPKKYISSGCGLLSSGDTLIIGDGTYTGASNMFSTTQRPPNGSSGAYTTVRAETIGGVIIDGQTARNPVLIENASTEYIIFNGIHFTNGLAGAEGNFRMGGTTGQVNHIKILNCSSSYSAAGSHGFSLWGASYCLIEDCWVWGHAQYAFHYRVCDHCIARRCVARLDYGLEGDAYLGSFFNYESSNMEWQNCIIIDSDQTNYLDDNDAGQGGIFGLWSQTNETSENVYSRGCIVLNSNTGTIGSFYAGEGGATASSHFYEDCIVWGGLVDNDNFYSKANSTPANPTYNHCVAGGSSVASGRGFYCSGAREGDVTNSIAYGITGTSYIYLNSVTDCISYTGGTDSSSIGTTSNLDTTTNPLTSGLLYLPRIETVSYLATAGTNSTYIGATITKKIGTSGTLHGEPGYATTTSDDLWPWPNEAKIKSDMATDNHTMINEARGFCALGKQINGTDDITLTSYIWEYLGNEIPADIYGATPAPPTLSFYLTNPSGSGAAQGSPHNSLGGYRSTSQVSASAMKNLFDDVTVAESIVGDTEYRFLDVYNSGDSSATKVQVFVSSDTSSSGTEITLGYNSTNQPHEDSWNGEALSNEDTAPASPSLTFGTYTRASPLHLGTIPAGRSVRICVKRTVTAGVPWTARDVGTIAVRYLGD